MTEIELELLKLQVAGRGFTIGYESDMYDGNASSDELYIGFYYSGEIADARLYGMHYITEREVEQDYDLSTEDALRLLLEFGEIKK